MMQSAPPGGKVQIRGAMCDHGQAARGSGRVDWTASSAYPSPRSVPGERRVFQMTVQFASSALSAD
jgi:hypothetical protein